MPPDAPPSDPIPPDDPPPASAPFEDRVPLPTNRDIAEVVVAVVLGILFCGYVVTHIPKPGGRTYTVEEIERWLPPSAPLR